MDRRAGRWRMALAMVVTAGARTSTGGRMAHDAFEQWRCGGRLEGVHFAPDGPVDLLEGSQAGTPGRVVSLQALAPEALYVVVFANGEDVAVLQSGLRPALPDEAAGGAA